MGDDPKTSVLDHGNRCRDIGNLLVVDAGCFTSDLEKSVALLIMGLSLRASEHLAEETRLGNA
jgi:choline dehydrogenase-like flavoprotein